jgi:hypothetical protein
VKIFLYRQDGQSMKQYEVDGITSIITLKPLTGPIRWLRKVYQLDGKELNLQTTGCIMSSKKLNDIGVLM